MEYGCVDDYGNHHYEQPYNEPAHHVRAPGQEYVHHHSLISDGHCGVALTFDTKEELLWMGSQRGYVTSYYSSALQKYTSFRVSLNHEIRQLEMIDHGVLALTSGCLRLYQRRGLQIFNMNFDELQEAQCMLPVPSNGRLLVGGQSLMELDLAQGRELIRNIDQAEESCTILRSHPRFVCSGEITGKISLRDPSSLNVVSTIDTHSAVLSDFDVRGNLLVTCGFSNRHGSLSVDRFLMVHDLRVMKAMPPIQVIFPPFRVRFLPAFSSRLCVVSQTGQFQLLDTDVTSTSLTPFIHTVEPGGGAILSFAPSSSCQALAFGDSSCYLHLFGASDEISFNSYSQPTQFADVVEHVTSIDITDELTPLSTIPTPYSHEGKRLSDWPVELCKVVYRPPPLIDPAILQTMRMVGKIGYAPNPGIGRRNQVAYSLDKKGNRRNPQESRITADSPELVPTRYLRIEAKYSRMGIEEFDFNLYNNTCFAGLEANLPNCYCNNLIQVLYFIEPLRCALESHICHREFCLACELGFLFHMMDTSQGMPCQASNFLRAFRTIPEASALGLILPESTEARKKVNFPLLVQSWIRFILQQILMETTEAVSQNDDDDNSPSPFRISEKRFPGKNSENGEMVSPITNVFGSNMTSTNVCKCKHKKENESMTLLCSLVYPDQYPGKPPIQVTFTNLLESSLSVELTMPAWCDYCEKYQTMVQTKRLKSLPDVLIVNSGLDNQQDLKFWESQIKMANGSKVSSSSSISGTLTEYSSPGGNNNLSRKPCRYGDLCTRLDCRFLHPRQKGQMSSPLPTYSQTPPLSENQSWLPLELQIKLEENGEVKVKTSFSDIFSGDTINPTRTEEKVEDNPEELSEKATEAVAAAAAAAVPVDYELTSVVVVVKDPSSPDKECNIVALVRVGPISHTNHRGGTVTQWYLFNDFTIVPVSKEEAVFLNFDWKLPCLLFYSRKDLNERHSLEVKNPITSDVFLEDVSLATPRGGRVPVSFIPLQPDEECLEIVAVDAEFVTLNQEEAEVHSDGKTEIRRPSQMSVGRVSVIRGSGPLLETIFLDDYISTQEQVVDYLTKFSGIQPGDLDASISSKHLTTLKSTYMKLRYLIDKGVIFVGHGLKNDFRVINLVVPAEQVVDTVFLFQLANKRMVSLRFLAWHFLGIKIQAETHDSIEDAKTALRLYREYQRLEKEGKINAALKELYEKGRLLQWKVPSIDEE